MLVPDAPRQGRKTPVAFTPARPPLSMSLVRAQDAASRPEGLKRSLSLKSNWPPGRVETRLGKS